MALKQQKTCMFCFNIYPKEWAVLRTVSPETLPGLSATHDTMIMWKNERPFFISIKKFGELFSKVSIARAYWTVWQHYRDIELWSRTRYSRCPELGDWVLEHIQGHQSLLVKSSAQRTSNCITKYQVIYIKIYIYIIVRRGDSYDSLGAFD